ACPAGQRLRADGRAELEVRWQPEAAPAAGHRVTLRAEALNRPRLLADLTAAISAQGVGIVSAEVEPPQELRVRHTYTVELPEPGALPALMRAMLRVSGVYDVSRPHAPEGGRTREGATRSGEGVTRSGEGARPREEARHSGENGDDRPVPGVRPSWGIHGRSTAFSGQRSPGEIQGSSPKPSSDQRTE
ncbi:ACT domain-containing protein, partial [Streptomyces sp. CBMA123]|uniref:ACT domain-containing protein n=1 Tax=Streptomyces sp. CBMA123 TaxID=1896313 RepID=UPI00294FF9D0